MLKWSCILGYDLMFRPKKIKQRPKPLSANMAPTGLSSQALSPWWVGRLGSGLVPGEGRAWPSVDVKRGFLVAPPPGW